MRNRLALHTWTLDTTPLAEVLAIARRTGWNAVELRRLDFLRAREAGRTDADVLALAHGCGLPVACVGAQHGWMFAKRAERQRLLEVLGESCRWAAALGSGLVMSPVDFGRGSLREAAASAREAGALAAEHGVRLALEHQSQAEQLNTLERAREVVTAAGHPRCGLLLDAYHLQRSGDRLRAVEDLAPDEIFYVQVSDVPRSGLEPGKTLDRLPPGQGAVPFRELFQLLAEKGYRGYLSYEGPNPSAWARDPEAVAREAVLMTRALLPPGPEDR